MNPAVIARMVVHAAFLVDWPGREVAGASIGRPLVDVVILRPYRTGMILHIGIGQPLEAPPAATCGAAAISVSWRARAADVSAWRAGVEQSATRHRGRSVRRDHGDRCNKS